MRISLEHAETILLAFGIKRATRAYDRWKTPDGFDLADFDEVLFESPFVFLLDWRCCLADEAAEIAEAVERLGASLAFEEIDDDEVALPAPSGGTIRVRYSATDEQTELVAVIEAIQAALPSDLEFRASPHNGGSDTDVYALLPRASWEELEALDAEVLRHFFVPLRPPPAPEAA